MTTDLDLIRDYMNEEDVDSDHLTSARATLQNAIAAEMNAATKRPASARSRPLRRNPVLQWSLGVAAVVVAAAILVPQILPSSNARTSEAAAAQIDRLADAVAPMPALSAGQWYQSRFEGVVSVDVGSVGSTPTPEAQAALPLTSEEWSNATGATCTSQQFGAATFATPANAQAWASLGLPDTPVDQPATNCEAGPASVGATLATLPLIDVTNITHDPSTLATELQDGTTGIPALDDIATGGPENWPGAVNVAGFIRLTSLLVGPTSGEWSGFGQEVLQAMALLPGVVSLGTSTAHSGQSGLAFSVKTTMQPILGGGSTRTPPTVVLDPQTGSLLEARNVTTPVLQVALQNLVESGASEQAHGDMYEQVTQWIDPVGSLSVVDQSALPSWIGMTHIVEAVALPSTTEQQVLQVLKPFPGFLGSAERAGQTTYDLTMTGIAVDVEPVVAALDASGLFSSVSVKL
jgi:hypothetical protein